MTDLGITQEYLLCCLTEKGKPCPLDKLTMECNYSITDKNLGALLNSVGESLAALGLVQEENGGLLGSKRCFVPQRDAVALVVDKVRAKLLEDGGFTQETLVLAGLLEKSGLTKLYFSKFERDEVKGKLKRILQAEENRVAGEMIDCVVNMIAITTALIAAAT